MLDLSHAFAGQSQLATDRYEGLSVRSSLEDLALPGLQERHSKPKRVQLGVLVEPVVGLVPVDDLAIFAELGVAMPVHHGSG